MTHFEMKSILKNKTRKLSSQLRQEESTQSHSIGAVCWNLPEENLQAHSSAPSGPFKSSAPSTRSQQHPRQNGLKDLRTLQECVNFIHHWKEQVAQVCKGESDPGEGSSQGVPPPADPRMERSLEESRKLILLWASELNNIDKVSPLMEHGGEDEGKGRAKGEQDLDKELQRIMEWAKELQSASESCGVQSEELGQVLRFLGLRKKRLFNLLPLLEFITWSLLKEDSKDMIPQLWLSSKQHTWKAKDPRYIPNSVWSWITSASADVTLDPLTNHPWLQLSDDHLSVQEGRAESVLSYSPQRFDSWPGVLGWEGYASGRHYWEVDIANNGYWRIGLTTADSRRHGRFPMNPQSGYWSLWRSTRNFYACTSPETMLPLGLVPRRIGIYLDYDEGQISFFNTTDKSHIYTFTGTFREKLYPLFVPLDGRTLITIVSPHKMSEF